MKRARNITDRAYRYRAVKNAPPGPKVCAFCGSKRSVEVGHIDGHEENSGDENLIWTCRSCNVVAGNTLRNARMGRLTNQYNPAGGAKTLAQWLTAVSVITPHKDRGQGSLFPSADNTMEVRDAVALIRATPASRRSSFARQIADSKRARTRYNPRKKKNPTDGAAAAYKDFHGRESDETVTVSRKVHFHKHLAAAGQLRALKVKTIDGNYIVSIQFPAAKKDQTILAFNEKKNQLYLEGGDQSVDLKAFRISRPHELETLGKVTVIDYHTSKDHLGSEGGTAVYRHKLRTTNQNGQHVTVKVARYPDLIYRVRDEQLEFSGGSYEILAEGIDR